MQTNVRCLTPDPADAADPMSIADRRRFSVISEERGVEYCECVIDIVAALFGVNSKDLRRPGRSAINVSRVRQIGMYVAHVVLQLTMTEVGRGFGRDRTTVQHACHLVEDMRDDAEFDQFLLMTERVTQAAFRGRLER